MMCEKKPINITVGKNIQAARERAGLTQDELSERIGIGEKSLSAIERGAVGISLSTLKKVCEELMITSDYLIFGEKTNDMRENDVKGISERLLHLSLEEYRIVCKVLASIFDAFQLNKIE